MGWTTMSKNDGKMLKVVQPLDHHGHKQKDEDEE